MAIDPAGLQGLTEEPGGRGWFIAATLAVATAAGCAACTEVFNFDIFWHLAGGEWMFQHGRVLGHDPFSIDPMAKWVNVHWLFQVIVSAVHAVGGFAALVWLKVLLAAATAALLAAAARRDASPAWIVVVGLLVAVALETRMRVRPEAFTLLFMMATIALVESVRRGGSANRLWLMPVIMLAWVNMHGLYVLGPALFWSAWLGATIDRRVGQGRGGNLAGRRAAWPLLAGSATCLVTPWPLEAAAQPVLLWTRISGQTDVFTHGVLEFVPTWESPYFLCVAMALLVPALAACAANFRRVPVAHWIWLAAIGTLAMMARRNVALTGPVCGYILAVHGGQVLRRIRAGRGPRSNVAAGAMNLAAMALSLAFVAGCATEMLFRVPGFGRRFGTGLQRSNYPIDIARYLGTVAGPGDIFSANWGDAGTFIHFSGSRRLWMDGRLEAHTLERFKSQRRISRALRNVHSALTVELPPEVRFIYVRDEAGPIITALARCRRYQLICVDETGVCFERLDFPGLAGASPVAADAAKVLAGFDRPLTSAGAVEGTEPNCWRWWKQNPPSRYYPIGTEMLWLARRPTNTPPDPSDLLREQAGLLAIRYLEAARVENLAERTSIIGMLAQAYQQRARQVDFASAAGPIDLLSARALYLYGQLDLTDLGDEAVRGFAEQHVDALVRARRLDAAARVAGDMLAGAPADLQPEKRAAWRRMNGSLLRAVTASQSRGINMPADAVARAGFLASLSMGQADEAIRTLRAIPEPKRTPAAWLMLGDLLLNAGKPEEARLAYEAGNAPAWRLALCDWVEDPLAPAARGPDMPQAYRRLIREIPGRKR